MASFELNLTEIGKDISDINGSIKNYKESMSSMKRALENSDSFWKDENNDYFVGAVRKDYIVFDNYIKSVSDYVSLINDFCDSLKSLILSETNLSSLSKFKIDTIQLSILVSNLNNVIVYLNNCISNLDSAVIPLDFKYKWTLENYLSCFIEYRNDIECLKNNLSSLYSGVNSRIVTYKTKVAQVERVSISSVLIQYKWNVSDSVLLKSNENVKVKKVTVNKKSVSESVIDVEKNVIDAKSYGVSISSNEEVNDIHHNHDEKLYDSNYQSNKNINDIKHTHDAKLYNLNYLNNNEELVDEKNESYTEKLYQINNDLENKNIENNEYVIEEKKYSSNDTGQAFVNVSEVNTSVSSNEYTVNANDASQGLNKSNVSISSNEYTVNANDASQGLNKSNVSISSNEYTVNANDASQGLNKSNVSISSNEYTVNANDASQGLNNLNTNILGNDVFDN